MMKRRGFVKLCAGAAAAVGANPDLMAQADSPIKHYERVLLVDARGAPITSDTLMVGESYVFNYPYATTPCFLLNLGKPTTRDASLTTDAGTRYVWNGGCGPDRSIVAFCAICAHKMSHPAKSVSFINYRHETVSFRDSSEHTTERSRVIYCCSEKSVYDPADGARVLGGPAPQPLTAIALEHDEGSNNIYAIGTSGGEMYQKFFDTFGFRLALEFETSDVRKPATQVAEVVSITEYSRTQMMC
jgi:arsenite oxidase small subunit